MTPENTQKLFAAFPHLYRGREKSVQESLMSFGFMCGDGWFELLWNLSQAIEDLARTEGHDPLSNAWPEATQVKEKFGDLRFHLRNCSEEMRRLIEEARVASAHIRE